METCPLCDLQVDAQLQGPLNKWLHVPCPRCGTYRISDIAVRGVRQQSRRHILSGYARQASDAGTVRSFTDRDVEHLLKSRPPVHTVTEQLNRLLLVLAGRLPSIGASGKIRLQYDYPIVFASGYLDMTAIVSALGQRGLLGISVPYTGPELSAEYQLSVEGWERVEKLTTNPPVKSKGCFVAMWFDESMRAVYDQGLAEGVRRAGYEPLRIDQIEHTGKIDDRIVAEIRSSALLLADFTGQRGGVYFEAGFAMGMGLPVIWTCRGTDVDKLHFDTRQYNHIVWSADKLEDLAQKVNLRIRAIMPTPR